MWFTCPKAGNMRAVKLSDAESQVGERNIEGSWANPAQLSDRRSMSDRMSTVSGARVKCNLHGPRHLTAEEGQESDNAADYRSP